MFFFSFFFFFLRCQGKTSHLPITQSTHQMVLDLQHKLNDTRCQVCCDRAMNNDFMIAKMHSMSSSIRRIETHLMGEPASLQVMLVPRAINFSISSKGLTNRKTLTDVTVAFFTEKCVAGFAQDKESTSWKNLELTERKRLRNLFGNIKRAVRMVLMHADSFPSPVPDSPDSSWKESLRRTATEAEDRIRNKLELGNKNLSIYKLTTHPLMKTLEETMKLPENTPEDLRKFFKSD